MSKNTTKQIYQEICITFGTFFSIQIIRMNKLKQWRLFFTATTFFCKPDTNNIH